MKKLYFSSALFTTVQLFLLLHPTTAQYAATPSGSSFENFKEVCLSKSINAAADRHRVWLNLTSTDGIYKQLLIGYIAGATNGWDVKYDAISLDAYQPADFYSINDRKKLVIQGRALPLELSDIVPLGYRSAVTGDLTISIDNSDGDLATKDIYIVDKETGSIHNLRDGGYTFSTEIGVFNDRFEMRYTEDQNLGIPESGIISQPLTVASKNKIISLQSRDALLNEVSIFDITGKLLYNQQKISTSDLEISSIQANAQILLVKTILDNGTTITKKVFF
ncbi:MULTISPECIES: T9SS sorting signal type C domain-containing protein [Flavobacterium]|uniref:T9SS sorting signal type C domain-containing protein n=1 Tax=Flavobacterium TaxID=237 RepID=UPI0011827312|nr:MULTISPECIES: T9SS sorting signal type C domain-containing protein [Flavobacterium]MCR4033626.1 T9SS sorting signal type C domain-containing protein [Flavobacterium panacis]